MESDRSIKGACVIQGFGNGYPEALCKALFISWYCVGSKGKQSRYRIQVWNQKGKVFWDTGFLNSDRSDNVRYEGRLLNPDSDYCMQVTVENEKGEVIESNIENFSTGLEDKQWNAQWLQPHLIEAAAPLFRKEFKLERNVVRAKLYLCGLGYHEAYINGRKAGKDLLSPTWTDYRKRVCYTTYDIKKLLEAGVNTIGVELGRGWYGKTVGIENEKLLFSAKISIEYENGEHKWIETKGEDGWYVNSVGPIKENSIYIGEVYDARDEISGWSLSGGNIIEQDDWKEAIVTEPPEGMLVPQNLEAIECVTELKPVLIWEPEEKVYLVDFGQNIAGVVELEVEEEEGRKISIRYGEILDEKRGLNTENLRMAQAKDVYFSKGKKDCYSPHFTYHGFRYAEVTGLTKPLVSTQIKALVIRNAVKIRGDFQCGNELINKIQSMCQWTESNNLHGVPTDCPQRDERLGWLNDLTVRAEEAIYNFDLHRFYAKFLQDIADEQGKQTGAITDTVPFFKYGNQPADPVCSSYLILGWLLYQHYGNKEILKDFYDGFAAWTNYLAKSTKEGIVTYSYYGDWASPITGSIEGSYGSGAVSGITPGKLMSTGFLYYNARKMAEMASILEKETEISKWNHLAEKTRHALNAHYYKKEYGYYAENSQASNTFMAWLDISPDKDKTVKAIVEDIYRHKIHLTTGNICTRYILEVLTENGYVDLAYELVTQTTYPSWGYMVEMGATTTWERWEYVTSGPLLGMASHNHPMYSTVSAWFYRYLLGIQVIKPGFKEFKIQPYIPEKLNWVKGKLDTIKGEITVEWMKKKENRLSLSVIVPFNTRCKMIIPESFGENFFINGKLTQAKDSWVWLEPDKYEIEIEKRKS